MKVYEYQKIRPLVKRHGGKYYMIDDIVALMPKHRTFVETHLGGGSILINKPKSEFEVAGDLDAGLINAWKQVKSNYEYMHHYLSGTEYCETAWNAAINNQISDDARVSAVAYIIKYRMSRGGMGKGFGWSKRTRGGNPGDLNAWLTFIGSELKRISDRIQNVQFHAVDAIKLVQRFGDSPDTLFYCDPPYLQETRTAKKVYGDYEMSARQHFELLQYLHDCRANVILSGYRSELYDSLLKDWKRYDKPMKNNSGQGKVKQDRIESIWIKP